MLDATLPAEFFARPAPELAVALLGCVLVRRVGDQWLGGIITETEAYTEDDAASHSYRGLTPRNAAMFQRPGTLYVYRCYGIHHCLNISSGREGQGEAVLLRSIEPRWGLELMRRHRRWPEPKPTRGLCDGPGKLTQALGIDLALDGLWPDHASELRLGPSSLSRPLYRAGPRVGISKETDRPWRFQLSADL